MSDQTTHFTRRRGLQALAAASLTALGALSGTAALAQDGFPSKPITILVPFAAGGTTDILARIVAQALQQELGQTVIVDNKPGAGGNIGAVAAARAPADGYTLFMGTVGTHAINAALYAKPGFDPIKDFAPDARGQRAQPAGSPPQPAVQDRQGNDRLRARQSRQAELRLLGQRQLHPPVGRAVPLHDGPGHGARAHKGSAPAITDLLGNQIAIMFDNMPSAIQHVRSGKLRPIAVTTAKRSPELPDVPTVAEAGVPGYEATSWFGLWTQAKTPAAVQQRLYTAIAKVLRTRPWSRRSTTRAVTS